MTLVRASLDRGGVFEVIYFVHGCWTSLVIFKAWFMLWVGCLDFGAGRDGHPVGASIAHGPLVSVRLRAWLGWELLGFEFLWLVLLDLTKREFSGSMQSSVGTIGWFFGGYLGSDTPVLRVSAGM